MTTSILITCKPHLSFSSHKFVRTFFTESNEIWRRWAAPTMFFSHSALWHLSSSSVPSRHSTVLCAKTQKHFGTMASMTRCICMRTLKTEPHTCRHGNNYAHNLCMPNHKETNAAKMVKTRFLPNFATFARTRP